MTPYCYVNLNDNKLCYRKSDPGKEFKQLLKFREEAENKAKFDEEFKNSMQVTQNDIYDEKHIWDIFEEKIVKFCQFLFFKDHYYEHLLSLARGFISEGVFHLEAREFLNVLMDEVFHYYLLSLKFY